MFADISKPPRQLPQPNLQNIGQGISLLNPLSRRGKGPGIILLVPRASDVLINEKGAPSPLCKWAEEGYAVAQIELSAWSQIKDPFDVATKSLTKNVPEFEDIGSLGLVVYGRESWDKAVDVVPESIKGVVCYADASEVDSLAKGTKPALIHLAGHLEREPTKSPAWTEFVYKKAHSHGFADPLSSDFHYSTESVSHTRNLSFLKPLVGGPYFDLEYIWDEHTYYEFADRSVEHTMSTMVQEPYVNHVPTMTGGVGRDRLTTFYRGHFIFNNSADTELELISRTIGIDRVIDEFIFKFTHDQEIDWMLPGIPPTNLKVEVPFTAVVNIRGDRLYHEHIGWDQGSVLRQLGLLPEYLPFPYALPDGKKPAEGHRFEYRVPVAGIETADKMREKESVPSNGMFDFKIREVKDSS